MHGAWRSRAQTVGAETLWRSYTGGQRGGPRTLLFVDRAAPGCAPSLLVTMDVPANEPPATGRTGPAQLRIDDQDPIALPMKVETLGAQAVWTSEAGLQARRAASDMARGRFMQIELPRGTGKAVVTARYALDGFAQADQRTRASCESGNKKGKP